MVPGSEGKYGDLLKEARTINLKEVDVTDIRWRHVLNGGVILEIPGKSSAPKADALATRLQETFASYRLIFAS